MSVKVQRLETFLAAHEDAVLVTMAEARGSVPREAGTWMLVSAEGQFGTVGGGQLEFLAIDHARKLLASAASSATLDIPLGPGIGQCCGGRVILDFSRLNDHGAKVLVDKMRAMEAAYPAVYVFGAGHVGQALAQALNLLPLRVTVVDMRPELLQQLPQGVQAMVSAMPEAVVRSAPAGTAFVAVTHDHALDFLITREALMRGDASYVGMIGSKTKRAQFRRWFAEEGGAEKALGQLICPIGGGVSGDKRPEIIAALTAAEILGKMNGKPNPDKEMGCEASVEGEGR